MTGTWIQISELLQLKDLPAPFSKKLVIQGFWVINNNDGTYTLKQKSLYPNG